MESDRRFFFEEYDGGIEVPRDFGTMSGLHENGNERTSLRKWSDKEALNSSSENFVCILFSPGEFGTFGTRQQHVLHRAVIELDCGEAGGRGLAGIHS